jgi:hypothetical protein
MTEETGFLPEQEIGHKSQERTQESAASLTGVPGGILSHEEAERALCFLEGDLRY